MTKSKARAHSCVPLNVVQQEALSKACEGVENDISAPTFRKLYPGSFLICMQTGDQLINETEAVLITVRNSEENHWGILAAFRDAEAFYTYLQIAQKGDMVHDRTKVSAQLLAALRQREATEAHLRAIQIVSYCLQCGMKLENSLFKLSAKEFSSKRRCESCKKANQPIAENRFCRKCGSAFTGKGSCASCGCH